MLQDLKNIANVKRCRDGMPNVCKQGRDYSEGKSSLHHFHTSLQLDVKRCRARALLIYLFNVFFFKSYFCTFLMLISVTQLDLSLRRIFQV